MPCPKCGYAPNKGDANVMVSTSGFVVKCCECDSWLNPTIPYDEFFETSIDSDKLRKDE